MHQRTPATADEVIRLSGINLVIDDTDHPLIIKVATLQASRMQVYFIDNDDISSTMRIKTSKIRETPEETTKTAHIFFVRGVMETVKKLRWSQRDALVWMGNHPFADVHQENIRDDHK